MVTVTILGCGGSAGVPLIGGADGRGDWGACDPSEPRNRRTRSSILIEGDQGQRLLVDAGPDMRAQFLAAGIGAVEAILFTHHHADHVMGTDETRVLNRITGKPLPIYGMARTLDNLRQRFDYAFLPAVGPWFFRPALEAHEVTPGETKEIAGLPLTLFSQDHAVMETLGFRIGGFAYSTDLVRLPEESLALLHGLDTWVVGCFQRAPHKVHANLEQVLEWVRIVQPRRTILTHMGSDLDYGWLCRTLPPGIEPGYDGMVLQPGAAPGR